ncbi:MAG: hypothetical protein FJ011_10005 [Chloroflexi bacterium]|nr:hypothetical protein [Chloroflexota bacterium]
MAHRLLASRVASMLGRKFEEGDWSSVYHAAKGIPTRGWSNLNIDVMHAGFGLEQKMLCVQSRKSLREYCGTTLMHPAATRAIRIPSPDTDPTEVAAEILRQFADLIQQRRRKVIEDLPDCEPDMRIGWLLWQESLEEFLYFEQEMLAPNPADYWAEWKESGGGARKASRNLWVYERETGRKRYSITTSAGAKIQPYFDVPAPNDSSLYHFRVQGEELDGGLVRIWITTTTALLLRQTLGDLDHEALSATIIRAAAQIAASEDQGEAAASSELAQPVTLTAEAYRILTTAFIGVSDEHRIQLFLHSILR